MAKKKNNPAPKQPAPKAAPKSKPKKASVRKPTKARVASGNAKKSRSKNGPNRKGPSKTKKKTILRRKKKGISGGTKGNAKRNKKKQGGGKRNKNPGRTKRVKVIAQRAYDKYLKKMYIPDESTISTFEMSNVVRERIKQNVRFDSDYPALFSQILIAAQGVDGSQADDILVDRYVAGPFGARMVISNAGQKDVYLNSDGVAIFNINGGVLKGSQHTETVVLPNKELRSGESVIEVGGKWVQSKAQAKSLGKWILAHQFDGGEVYSMEVFANPYIDVGDIVVIEHNEIGLTDNMHFVVVSVNNSYSEGMTTDISVRRVYPDAGKSFLQRQGIPQSPVLL